VRLAHHAIYPSRQRFTFADRCRQTPIMDSMALVERRVRANVGGTPSRSTVRVSARHSRRLAATGPHKHALIRRRRRPPPPSPDLGSG